MGTSYLGRKRPRCERAGVGVGTSSLVPAVWRPTQLAPPVSPAWAWVTSRAPLHPKAEFLTLGFYSQLAQVCFLWWKAHSAEICSEMLISLNITWTLCQTTLLNSTNKPLMGAPSAPPHFQKFSIHHQPLAKQLLRFDKYSISPRIYWEDSWGSPHPSHTHAVGSGILKIFAQVVCEQDVWTRG